MEKNKKNQAIRPIEKTKARIIINENTSIIDFNFHFSAGEVLSYEKKIIIFQDKENSDSPILGKVFDLKGDWIYDIPFPSSPYPNHVKFYFHWCSYLNEKIHITFVAQDSGYRDFGINFDLMHQVFEKATPTR